VPGIKGCLHVGHESGTVQRHQDDPVVLAAGHHILKLRCLQVGIELCVELDQLDVVLVCEPLHLADRRQQESVGRTGRQVGDLPRTGGLCRCRRLVCRFLDRRIGCFLLVGHLRGRAIVVRHGLFAVWFVLCVLGRLFSAGGSFGAGGAVGGLAHGFVGCPVVTACRGYQSQRQDDTQEPRYVSYLHRIPLTMGHMSLEGDGMELRERAQWADRCYSSAMKGSSCTPWGRDGLP